MFSHPIICIQLMLIHFQILHLEMFLESADERREELSDQIESARAELEQLYMYKNTLEMNFVA